MHGTASAHFFFFPCSCFSLTLGDSCFSSNSTLVAASASEVCKDNRLYFLLPMPRQLPELWHKDEMNIFHNQLTVRGQFCLSTVDIKPSWSRIFRFSGNRMQGDKIERKWTAILKTNKNLLFFLSERIFEFWHWILAFRVSKKLHWHYLNT